jgi:hypothetical protein
MTEAKWPGDNCDMCGGNSYIAWQVTNDCWHRISGSHCDDVLCINCFFKLAYQAGKEITLKDFELIGVPNFIGMG